MPHSPIGTAKPLASRPAVPRLNFSPPPTAAKTFCTLAERTRQLVIRDQRLRKIPELIVEFRATDEHRDRHGIRVCDR
jgi:hypothetical protein